MHMQQITYFHNFHPCYLNFNYPPSIAEVTLFGWQSGKASANHYMAKVYVS